ncbi:hypothetical protein ABID30_001843 [Enterococcus rotai]|uniref:Uncharacterized protein n=1 Tax=Enterococcus rotai TaxID=118060 RepID=A0A0U2VH49_9ENTE|nr:DUF916 and DUF3324 domain-containing protein [Enterococcus rotai]ALS36956.1 hypothetical protein ATZ35_07215 [Enterococcus rotai]
MKTNKFIYFVLFMSLFLCSYPDQALAKGESSNLGYSVSAVHNGKQIDPEKSYFYIQTVPGQEQVLKVNVRSTQKEPIKIKVYTTNAYTGDGGTIEYTEDEKVLDPTLVQPISSIVEVETPSITVENYEEKEATFKLMPPNENYTGVKMGALVFELDDAESKEQVSSKFSYRIGLITSETGDDYRDAKTLNLLEAKSTLKLGKKMILATLQNPEPKILGDLEITAEVKEKDNQTILKKKNVTNYSVAPNSHFEFEIDWGTGAVKAGTYTIVMNANNGYSDWQFEKDFTITGDQAKKMNEESSFNIITPIWIKVGTIVLMVALVVIVFFILIRRKKMETTWKIRRKKRKKKKKERR